MTDPRYPIGPFEMPATVDEAWRRERTAEIEALPPRLRAAAAGLSPEQLGTPYREGGWTVLQVIHHVADSHMNAYVRFKLGLTEDAPAVKTYEEALWARLDDSRLTPPEVSLALLDALHTRWVVLLRSLAAADFARTVRHPDHGLISLDRLLGLYAWHGRHHTSHITTLRAQKGW